MKSTVAVSLGVFVFALSVVVQAANTAATSSAAFVNRFMH
jgi:hypothetical protein